MLLKFPNNGRGWRRSCCDGSGTNSGLLADADPAAGEKLAKKCTACHVFAADGANKVGPVLWGWSIPRRARLTGFHIQQPSPVWWCGITSR